MKISVVRKYFTEHTTIGELLLNDEFFCYTLEDKDRRLEEGGDKVYGETAIPRGTYQVLITYSNRFKQLMPLLVDVPLFDGVRIHAGNTFNDTHGCILVGYKQGTDSIGNSRAAYNDLLKHIEEALDRGQDVTIEVK